MALLLIRYAISLALSQSQRVVYTSPIKALSNQKYREFAREFSDVGLLTGDVSLSPNASCLVMTTEILRSMLFKGAELVREVAFVIFDEVHYMRDLERGVVWEETIILLPTTVTLIFLSATISNAVEFAEWVCWLKKKPCHVVFTEFRPVPLEHYICPMGRSDIVLIKKGNESFDFGGFDNALSLADPKAHNPINNLIHYLSNSKLFPALIFSFSRAESEKMALKVSNADLTSAEEKELIDVICANALSSLADEDKELACVSSLLTMLRNGIGVHHSGLLPILKEVVEVLFGEGLIKLLFTTETFAMGVNMPAKSVVFTALKKFDGNQKRPISSNEYIQMSGRAGRRGLDTRGVVIIMGNDQLLAEQVADLVSGKSSPLKSQFRLTYQTLLNLLRLARADVDVNDPKKVLEKSFYFFQKFRLDPLLGQKLKKIEASLLKTSNIIPEECFGIVESYHKLNLSLTEHLNVLQAAFKFPELCLPFLTPGRILLIASPFKPESTKRVDENMMGQFANEMETFLAETFSPEEMESDSLPWEQLRNSQPWGFGAVVNLRKRFNSLEGIVVDVLLPCRVVKRGANDIPFPPVIVSSQNKGETTELATSTLFEVIGVPLSMIQKITQCRLYMKQHVNLDREEGKSVLYVAVRECVEKYGEDPPLIDITNPDFYSFLFSLFGTADQVKAFNAFSGSKIIAQATPFENRFPLSLDTIFNALKGAADIRTSLNSHPFHQHACKDKWLKLYVERKDQEAELLSVTEKRKQLQQQFTFEQEFKARCDVLKRLEYISEDGLLLTKGKVAAEIGVVDELVITEMIFSGFFNNLDIPTIGACLSCLVPVDRVDEEPNLPPFLKNCFTEIIEHAKKVVKVCLDCGLLMNESKFVASFHCSVMLVVYGWCNGDSFATVCKLTPLFEGSLIRLLRRMEEVYFFVILFLLVGLA